MPRLWRKSSDLPRRVWPPSRIAVLSFLSDQAFALCKQVELHHACFIDHVDKLNRGAMGNIVLVYAEGKIAPVFTPPSCRTGA